MSKSNNEMTVANMEPSGAPATLAAKGKSLRADPKAEGDSGASPVFRLDSLGGGGEAGAPGVGASTLTAPKSSKISHAAVFFAILIVVGGGLLFAMRKIGINPMSAIAKVKEPDIDLTKNGAAPVDHKRVLRDLSESAVKAQVPIEQVQKNPFEIPEVVAAPTSEDPELAAKLAAEKARKDAEARKARLDSIVAGLKIHGILNGTNPVARINDKAVRVGDKIEEVLEVTAIHGREVELECDGQAFVLSLDDQPGKAPTRKPGRKK